jgi:hypothetical protein
LFSRYKLCILYKKWLGSILGDFPKKTHLVTLRQRRGARMS